MTPKPAVSASLSLDQAIGQSAPLRQLIEAAQESRQCLDTVKPLIPPGMHGAIKAGPLEQGAWCLIVANNACAAKLRQLIPAMQAHLQGRGKQVTSIRLKIQAR